MSAVQSGIPQQDLTSSTDNQEGQWQPKQILIWGIIACAIVAGIWFRGTNIDNKFFWKDEIVSQYFISPKVAALPTNVMLTKTQMLDTVQIDRTKSLADVGKNLYCLNAEQLPLYYMATRIWCEAFGEGPIPMRLFSVLGGIVFLGAIYFLGLELFQSRLAGGISAAVVALSPFHVNFSQQARPYEWWAVTIALACLTYLRASRKPSFINWTLFAVALTVSQYTHFFSATLTCAILVAAILQHRLSRGFIASFAASGLCFVPWALVVQTNNAKSNWMIAQSFSVLDQVADFFKMLTSSYFDLNTTPGEMPVLQALFFLPLLIAAVLFIAKKTERTISIFLLSMFAVPSILMLQVAILQKLTLTQQDRYWMPTLIALSLCVAGAIWSGFNSKERQYKLLAFISLLGCLGFGFVSCATYSRAMTWHDHGTTLMRAAETINHYDTPTIIMSPPPRAYEAISMCYVLRDDARILVKHLNDPLPTDLPRGYFDVKIGKSKEEKADPSPAAAYFCTVEYIPTGNAGTP